MRKVTSCLIPVAALIVFVIIMQGGCYFVYSHLNKDSIPYYIDQVETDLLAEHWDIARADLHCLDSAWNKVIPVIQFHAEMDAIDGIKENIARLNGAISAQDLGLALAEIDELSEHWDNLTN